jgi:hypothetical protein
VQSLFPAPPRFPTSHYLAVGKRVTNGALGTGRTVEVIERLEPTIGLEPMTCRLRTEGIGKLSDTGPTSNDVTTPALELLANGEDPVESS